MLWQKQVFCSLPEQLLTALLPREPHSRADRSSLMDKPDARASLRVAIIYATPAAAVPIKIHLADNHPATRQHHLHMRHMPQAARTLHTGRKNHRRIDRWRRGDII